MSTLQASKKEKAYSLEAGFMNPQGLFEYLRTNLTEVVKDANGKSKEVIKELKKDDIYFLCAVPKTEIDGKITGDMVNFIKEGLSIKTSKGDCYPTLSANGKAGESWTLSGNDFKDCVGVSFNVKMNIDIKKHTSLVAVKPIPPAYKPLVKKKMKQGMTEAQAMEAVRIANDLDENWE